MRRMISTGDRRSSAGAACYRDRRNVLLLFVLTLSVLLQDCGVDSSLTTFGKRPASRDSSSSLSVGAKRQKTGNRVMEPAFANAGKQAGLEIWRIEDFKPVPYPKKDYGKFYDGDSYIILNTRIDKSGHKSYDLHFWLGADTSQDEAGAAAIYTVQLDDQLNGEPVQHREVQEHESQLFLSNFKNTGIRYLPGGVNSAFFHVDRNAFEKRLFEVKGSRNIRVKQVDFSISSMNQGDCFILDVGLEIYVYVGKKARRVEKLKAINAANQIRDQDHGGKARVCIVDEFSPKSDFDDFFAALGEGSKEEVPEESAGGDDQQFENSEDSAVSLYRVSDRTGSLEVTKVAQKPLDASMLDPSDCFILDTRDANLYVWIGKKCDEKEKREAMKKAEEFIKTKNRPRWTHVQRIVQGAEPAAFTAYFRSWQVIGETHPRLLRSASNAAQLFHCHLRSIGHKWKVEEVKHFDQGDLDDDDVMILDVHEKVYVWIGKGASEAEKNSAPQFAETLLDRQGREGVPVEVINQGEESEEFTGYFPAWDPDYWNNIPDIRTYIKSSAIRDILN